MQHNELTEIPQCLLELPSLTELILSYNHLMELPDVQKWSPGLNVLDLAFNELTNLPNAIFAPSLCKLNIASNKFHFVPLCICSFTSLQYLELSGNVGIHSLPVEMHRLSNLTRLGLQGLNNLKNPPRNVQHDAQLCARYLNSKLCNFKKFCHMQLMVLGNQDRGKTTLVTRLRGNEIIGPNQSTVGVDVSEWNYGGNGIHRFQFSIWDFGGQEEYYATQQCFLSVCNHTLIMYLLLFNLMHGEQGVDELKPWLDNIALRAPRSCVIIVGTHLDEVEDSERPQIDKLLSSVANLANMYEYELQVSEILPVGLVNRLENIGALRDAIYQHAYAAGIVTHWNQHPIMRRDIHASYFQLIKELEKIQQLVKEGKSEPIMHAEKFKEFVKQLKLPNIHSDREIRTATHFLNEVGTILHYEHSHNLNELYFIDPHWLCDMISKVVTVKEKNNLVKNGILHSKYIPFLYRDKRFPWQYFEQYVTLLDHFEIALPLDSKRMLIPSMLPTECPDEADLYKHPDGPYYMRYITFGTSSLPGFWSQVISRIMHTVPEVCHAIMNASISQEEDEDIFSLPSSALSSVRPPGEFPPVNMQIPNKSPGSHFHGPSTPIAGLSTNAPIVLPNISRIVHNEDFGDIDPDDVKLVYWREGMVYSGPTVSFAVESLFGAKNRSNTNRGGVLLKASPTRKGTKTIYLLVNLVMSLIHDWYPGFSESTISSVCNIEQRVPCYECLKNNRSDPYEFRIDQLRLDISNDHVQIKCAYNKEDPAANHLISLNDLVPDILLQYLDPIFLLEPLEIQYQEDANFLLGNGRVGKVYRGKCRDKSVAIKKYNKYKSWVREDAFVEFQREVTILERCHHPCLVSLVGVRVHPMILVLEEAPMGSLEKYLIKKPIPISRVAIFRIAAQVAAALRFLHNAEYIFRDLQAANVLVWSLDPESLCHCKLTDFKVATHPSLVGPRCVTGTRGFIAPEILYTDRRKAVSITHKADVFSFGMLLYQMIARRHPFHNVQPVKIDARTVSGVRPDIADVPFAETGYFFLTYLMKTCWEDKPELRPQTSTIINKVSGLIMQSVIAVRSVNSRFSVRQCCTITPQNYACTILGNHPSKLWVFCHGAEGTEVNIYNTRMMKVNTTFIKDCQVQCVCVCGEHVWVGSQAGIECGVIEIFSIASCELVHNIRMEEHSISCITCSDSTVYLGTLEGYCFSFCMDIQSIARPLYKCISDNALDGIVVTDRHVWVSHTKSLYYLNLETLQTERSWHRQKHKNELIGQLSKSYDGKSVWSAHLGGTILSAWDVQTENHLYNINVQDILIRTDRKGHYPVDDMIMTAMTTAIDTVFVGLATGHVMVFHEQDVLMVARPYTEYVRFLCPILSEGPCQTEKCMVVSGARGFTSPLPEYDVVLSTAESEEDTSAGVLVLFEAYPGSMLRQLKCVQDDEGNYLTSHDNLARMIQSQHFKDATHIVESVGKHHTEKQSQRDDEHSSSMNYNDSGTLTSSTEKPLLRMEGVIEKKSSSPSVVPVTTVVPCTTTAEEQNLSHMEINQENSPIQRQARTNTVIQETIDVEIQGQIVHISFPKPTTITKVMSELAMNTSQDTAQNHCLGYRALNSGMMIKILTDDEFQQFLGMESRPSLTLILK